MDDEKPCIKTLIIDNTLQEKNFTQSGVVLALMPREDSVGLESVKISKGGVANRRAL